MPLVRPVKVFRESEAGTKRADVTSDLRKSTRLWWDVAKSYLHCIVDDTFGDAVFVLRADLTLLSKLCCLCNTILAFQTIMLNLE